MPSVWISRRRTKAGADRWRVGYRTGGRDTNPQHGGSFKTMREARLRRGAIEAQLAATSSVQVARRVSVVKYEGKRIGTVWRLKYEDADRRQVMITLGRERDGYTRGQAEEVAARFLLAQQSNPLNALLWLADSLVARQERELGDALPHLYVAQTQIRQLHRLASAELAANPDVFNEPSQEAAA